MKKIVFSSLLVLMCSIGNTQVVDLSNAQRDREIKPIEYDGSFLIPNYSTTKEMKAGLVGQTITVLEISGINIKDSEGNYGSYKDEKIIKSKNWRITEYVNEEYSDKFKITNDTLIYTVDFGSTDNWFINGGLENLQKKMLGKSYVPFKNSLNLKSIDDSGFSLDGFTLITIKDLRYAKLSSYTYGLVLFFDNGLITEFEPETQPKDKGWIAVGGRYAEDLLVEKSTMDLYIKENSKFIDQMREGKVAIGMTEHQTRLAWGMPTSSLKNIAGYEKVNSYGETGNSLDLYFKDGKLALIN